ncbi:MDR family MFS transporter [Streptomyces sp. NPDC090109]|uniref:MDR family MFS transporter n=1 Tax=Streptomyces sp. NPDC090109 TaxID=3365948 RepID=UPI003809981E
MEQLMSEDPAAIGPYRIVARLGAGGMGLVYLGRSEAGRTVAVKVVQAEHARHPEFRRRFAREVAAARRVGGEWTAAVLDADTEAPVPWVATQYIAGPDLTTVVARDFGPLPEHSVRVLAHRLAVALGSVHGAGLIHRDLKPSNVLVTVDGPRVIDFGIARAMDGLAGDSLHTRTGMLIGSPGFMSPEQVRGRELTPASDVFCLGAVLVYAATGRLLFGATETGLSAHLFRIAEEEPDLTGVPESLVDLVRACLEKDPARRPTPAEVAARTVPDRDEEWLPGSVLAQLGRRAAQLLDFAPEVRAVVPDPRIPAAPVPQPRPVPAPPAYALTTPAAGFGPAVEVVPGARPGAWSAAPTAADAPAPSPRRWWGLTAAVLAQLLVVMGASTVDAALPAIGYDLGLAASGLGLMYLVHALAFGGLLILGGHVADLLGRGRALTVGSIGFAGACAIGATAGGSVQLVVAHALQGVFAALLSAASLALVCGGFTDPGERGRAFGIYAVTVGGGLAIGAYASGLLVDALDWRGSLYAAVPLAAVVALVASRLWNDRPDRASVRFDAPGVLLGTGGLLALVYGLHTVAGTYGSDGRGWSDPWTVVPLVAGTVLLLAFAGWQTRTGGPLVAPRVLADRHRAGSLLALLFAGAGALTLFLLLSRYLQGFQYRTPGAVGLLLLPMAGGVLLGSTLVAGTLQHRLPPRHLIAPGLLLAAVGTALLTGLDADTSYLPLLLPATLLAGLGLGLALGPLLATATGTATPSHAGGTAATVLTAHNLGGWIAFPLLGTVLAALIPTRIGPEQNIPQPLVEAAKNGFPLTEEDLPDALADSVAQLNTAVLDGYSVAFWCASALLLLASLLAGTLITTRTPER